MPEADLEFMVLWDHFCGANVFSTVSGDFRLFDMTLMPCLFGKLNHILKIILVHKVPGYDTVEFTRLRGGGGLEGGSTLVAHLS